MDKEHDSEFIATRFLDDVEEKLKSAESVVSSPVTIGYPMGKEEFEQTIQYFLLIKDLAKERGIRIQINDTDNSMEEYGTFYAFNISRISNT